MCFELRQRVDVMQLLLVLFGVCCCAAAASEELETGELKFLPRYTLLSEGKKKDQDLDKQPGDTHVSEPQPWRRLNYVNYGGGGQHNGWPANSPAASPAAIMGPGLLLLGVNLGALLYMLLGLLGLAPPQRFGGTWPGADIYRNDRQDFAFSKKPDMYS